MIDLPEESEKNFRSFGIGAAVILSFFAFLSWRKAGVAFPYFLGTAAFFLLFALTAPAALRPIFRAWMKIAGVIGAVNTVLLLGFVYYVMMTPMALFQRLMGSDPLDLKDDPGRTSYWHDRGEEPDKKSYERQF